MCVVPSVSVGKLRRACCKGQVGAPTVRARIIDVDFVGRIGRHSAATDHIQPAVEVQPTVSPVARGMVAIVPMVLASGSKLKEVVVSTTVPPCNPMLPPT